MIAFTLTRLSLACASLALCAAVPTLGADGSATSVGTSAAQTGVTSAQIGDREIRALGSGSMTIKTAGDLATVQIGSHRLEIGKDHLQLDDGMPSSISPTARIIQVQSGADGMLTVTADSKEVLRAKLGDTPKTGGAPAAPKP